MGIMNTKHKSNNSMDPGMLSGKHISMNGLPYDKMKGLTPVANKSGGGIKGTINSTQDDDKLGG